MSKRLCLCLLVAAAARAASPDTYLPWEGGPECYRKWANGPRPDADFFPVSVWLQSPARAAEYKAIGINQFVGLWKGPTAEQLQALAAAGMPVMAAQQEFAIGNPLVRGWTMMDEPDNAQPKPGGGWGSCVLPPVIAERAAALRAADPTRPVYLNLGQGVANENYKGRGSECARHNEHYPEYIRAADIVSFDVYPVNSNYPLSYVGTGIDRLRKWAGYRKPVWNWIETTAIRGGPKPTPAQIRAQVWMSIVHGAMGIGYFCHQFKPKADEAAPLHDAETKQALKSINAEIASLARVLNTPSVANGVTATPEMDMMLKREGGATYLFAMPARDASGATATFTLRDCGNLRAEALGEGRWLPVKNGVFQDRFDQHQVHIYKLAFVPPLPAPKPIAARMREFIEKGEIPGAVTLIATRHGVTHFEAVGDADPGRKSPMRKDSIFWIASMTKPITATAVMMLVDEGKISVEDPVSKYIPALAELKLADGRLAKVTLRHMLTHTSGMGEPTSKEAAAARTLAELVPAVVSKPVKFEPGSKWQYCQSGINMLGRVVEVVSGKPFDVFLEERIFRPLGMKDTAFYLTAGQMRRCVTPAKVENGKLVEATVSLLFGLPPTSRDRYPAPNGGLFSSAPDYARFARMILNGGALDGKRYLSAKAVEAMTAVQTGGLVTGFTPGNAWGLGWCLIREPQGVTAMLAPGSFGHGGAYGTQAWIDPRRGVALILMVQRSNFQNSDASDVRRAFQEAALGL